MCLGLIWLAGLGGTLIGLLISILAASERTAVAFLPLALIPQLLLSRAAYGDGGRWWGEQSPFGKIAMVKEFFQSDAGTPQGIILLLGSAPLITRPATAVLDLWANLGNGSGESSDLCLEGVYLLLLLIAHVIVVVLAFRWAERRWDRLLR